MKKKSSDFHTTTEKEIYAERNAIYASIGKKPLKAYYWDKKRQKYKRQNEERMMAKKETKDEEK